MYMTILGRQSAIGLAELERVYGDASRFSTQVALVKHEPSILRLGGSLKTGKIIKRLPRSDWRTIHTAILGYYGDSWRSAGHKITLGISAYGLRVSSRDIQRTGLELKKHLKSHGTSLRLIPNATEALNTATSHHNKLGLSANKVELLIARGEDGSALIAESTGAQHITALAKRDQGRPKRDAFVGMLPPKLAQIIVNLAVGQADPLEGGVVLDPFCGTGVLLQEATLMGFDVYGSDLSEKMVDFTDKNLMWLLDQPNCPVSRPNTEVTPDWRYFRLEQGDATTHKWRPVPQFVACETYLGQPFSAPPSPSKLREVRGNCNHIIGSFLSNIGTQLRSDTQLCVAVPAWRSTDASFTHLPLTRELESFGFRRIPLDSIKSSELLYYREDQVVARELLVIQKI
jgi:tRNA G10  N-methylase Trm11